MMPRKKDEERNHPHADAVYLVFQQTDLTFAVRVSIPDSYPTTITSFTSESAASDWIEEHRAKVKQRTGLRAPRKFGFVRR